MIVYHLTVWSVLALAVQFGLPVLIDLVTTTVTRNGLKTVLLGLLTVAVTLGTGAVDAHDTGGVYDLGNALLTAVGGFLLSLVAYYKVWKGSRVQSAAQGSLITAPTPPSGPEPDRPAPGARHLYPVPPMAVLPRADLSDAG